jgi:hypothetical protein
MYLHVRVYLFLQSGIYHVQRYSPWAVSLLHRDFFPGFGFEIAHSIQLGKAKCRLHRHTLHKVQTA